MPRTKESGRRQPLVQSVEDLSAEGYVVLTAEQAEQVTSLLGRLVFESVGDEDIRQAETLLSEWPECPE